MTARARIALFTASAAVTSVFFIDFCSLVYACGCRSLWAGADAACNVHIHGVKHCPWCSIGRAGSLGVWATIITSQAVACFGLAGLSPPARCISAFAAFPLTGGVLAFLAGAWLGYWD